MHCSCSKADVAWLPSLEPAPRMHCPGPRLRSMGQLGALQDLAQALGERQWASPPEPACLGQKLKASGLQSHAAQGWGVEAGSGVRLQTL